MFGFSLQKLLVLVAVIGAVWYGFKLIGRLQEQRKADTRLRARAARAARAASRAAGRGAAEPTGVEELVQCPVCQAYVQARAPDNCGRADCPY